jgi:hypothetical protein
VKTYQKATGSGSKQLDESNQKASSEDETTAAAKPSEQKRRAKAFRDNAMGGDLRRLKSSGGRQATITFILT